MDQIGTNAAFCPRCGGALEFEARVATEKGDEPDFYQRKKCNFIRTLDANSSIPRS